MPASDKRTLEESRRYWNQEAAIFDAAPDHGLHDPANYAAWQHLLCAWMPLGRSKVLDVGCGTGSISVLLARLGHRITGIDLSSEMISLAAQKTKAARQHIDFVVMDAAYPPLSKHQFDVIMCRHLLWALPKPYEVLRRWAELLKPSGRLLIIDGYWENQAGLRAENIVEALPETMMYVVKDLSGQLQLWGREVTDERYAVIAQLR